MATKNFVQADTVNGVYQVRALDDFNAPTVLSETDFLEALPTLSQGEEYAAELSPEMFQKIKTMYGIKSL